MVLCSFHLDPGHAGLLIALNREVGRLCLMTKGKQVHSGSRGYQSGTPLEAMWGFLLLLGPVIRVSGRQHDRRRAGPGRDQTLQRGRPTSVSSWVPTEDSGLWWVAQTAVDATHSPGTSHRNHSCSHVCFVPTAVPVPTIFGKVRWWWLPSGVVFRL